MDIYKQNATVKHGRGAASLQFLTPLLVANPALLSANGLSTEHGHSTAPGLDLGAPPLALHLKWKLPQAWKAKAKL